MNTPVSTPLPVPTLLRVPTKSNKAVVWSLIFFLGPLLSSMLFLLPRDHQTHEQESVTQPPGEDVEHRVGVLVSAGLSRADAEKSVRAAMQNEAEARAAKEPAQIRPPSYRVYKSKTDEGTAYVVSVNTTDAQLRNLLWFFRKKVRAGAFADIGIRKPTSKNWGQYNYKAGMLLVYRGEKCANEEFISDAQVEKGNLGPCGYGEHDDAYYQWGFPSTNRDGFFDGGGVRTRDGDVSLVFEDKGTAQ